MIASKTDGTLWGWGKNEYGVLGQNNAFPAGCVSSRVQIPGTNWDEISAGHNHAKATKTDGTLWVWGRNRIAAFGIPSLGENDRSSPVQVPGTNWDKITSFGYSSGATKTDGTLWAWGYNTDGQLGQNNTTTYSSPIQVGSGTDWTNLHGVNKVLYATLVDNTP